MSSTSSSVAFDSITDQASFASGNDADVAPYDDRTATASAHVAVMILDPDPVIAAGLATVLREHGFQIVPTPESGRLVYRSLPADIALTDYQTALRRTDIAPGLGKHTIIFTNCDSEAKICRASESGAKVICCMAAAFRSCSKAFGPCAEQGSR